MKVMNALGHRLPVLAGRFVLDIERKAPVGVLHQLPQHRQGRPSIVKERTANGCLGVKSRLWWRLLPNSAKPFAGRSGLFGKCLYL